MVGSFGLRSISLTLSDFSLHIKCQHLVLESSSGVVELSFFVLMNGVCPLQCQTDLSPAQLCLSRRPGVMRQGLGPNGFKNQWVSLSVGMVRLAR